MLLKPEISAGLMNLLALKQRLLPEGPLEWISPLVVVPKSDGDVRVCVDMRRANEAII